MVYRVPHCEFLVVLSICTTRSKLKLCILSETREGWLFVAAIIDLFSRKVIGYAMADRMRTELVVQALRMALMRGRKIVGDVSRCLGCRPDYTEHESQRQLLGQRSV